MIVTLSHTVLSLFTLEFSYQMINDFWDHDFDEDHNCDDVLLLEYSKTNQVRCALVGMEPETYNLKSVKRNLLAILFHHALTQKLR